MLVLHWFTFRRKTKKQTKAEAFFTYDFAVVNTKTLFSYRCQYLSSLNHRYAYSFFLLLYFQEKKYFHSRYVFFTLSSTIVDKKNQTVSSDNLLGCAWNEWLGNRRREQHRRTSIESTPKAGRTSVREKWWTGTRIFQWCRHRSQWKLIDRVRTARCRAHHHRR